MWLKEKVEDCSFSFNIRQGLFLSNVDQANPSNSGLECVTNDSSGIAVDYEQQLVSMVSQ